jgi:hypothetical protein
MFSTVLDDVYILLQTVQDRPSQYECSSWALGTFSMSVMA